MVGSRLSLSKTLESLEYHLVGSWKHHCDVRAFEKQDGCLAIASARESNFKLPELQQDQGLLTFLETMIRSFAVFLFCFNFKPVSYTHLTLPTNREV